MVQHEVCRVLVLKMVGTVTSITNHEMHDVLSSAFARDDR